ncbi:MAG: BrnT family toxin [Anaerolineae bacterium]|nr:BrnT family toxin [Anaerolineae bacterium]
MSFPCLRSILQNFFAIAVQYRRLERGKIVGEDVYAAYGRTNGGRYVTIVFIFKAGSKALILSARDMDKKERKQYGRKN